MSADASMTPEMIAQADALFEEFVAALRADVNELIDFAEYVATGKLPAHRTITLEQFDARADAATAAQDRAYAKARAQRAANREARETRASSPGA